MNENSWTVDKINKEEKIKQGRKEERHEEKRQ